MSHHIYTTPGFIVHSAPHAEAGKYFLIFTRDLGMIGATAQGVRLSQSKLRFHAQDFSCSLFSIVKGKEVWRMTGAKEIEGKDDIKNADDLKLYARILSLLRRLVSGEEKNEKLFDIIYGFHEFLTKNPLQKEEREMLEYLVVLRMLNELGYVKNTFGELVTGQEIDEDILEKVKENKDQIVKEINSGLKESQL